MARGTPSVPMPLLAVALILLLEGSVAFNAKRNGNMQAQTQMLTINIAAQNLRNAHAVGMTLRLPATSNLQSPSSWMGGYLRAIDMHSGDLQMSNRRGALLSAPPSSIDFIMFLNLVFDSSL